MTHYLITQSEHYTNTPDRIELSSTVITTLPLVTSLIPSLTEAQLSDLFQTLATGNIAIIKIEYRFSGGHYRVIRVIPLHEDGFILSDNGSFSMSKYMTSGETANRVLHNVITMRSIENDI